jgi:hypothetical protein
MNIRTRRRLTLSIGFLLAIQLVTSAGAIVLFGRMTPAIERILRENVYSAEAVEVMLVALAEAEEDPGAHERFFGALARAKDNVTEEDERPPLATLERVGAAAISGDGAATQEALSALRRLGNINRAAMQRADQNAQRLGSAGAWAAVFLGLAGLGASALTVRNLHRRLLLPLAEIVAVARAARANDPRRRCVRTHASGELETVMVALDELLDDRERAAPRGANIGDAREHRALIAMLDRYPEPAIVIDEHGEIVAASASALEHLAKSSELKRGLSEVAAGASVPTVVAESLGEAGTLCTLNAD